MKTSIFNMSFTLPPMIEMTEVEKDMPSVTIMVAMWPICPPQHSG